MKKYMFTGCLSILFSGVFSQSPASSYTNATPNPVPGQPSVPAELYQGTNPPGGDNTKSNITIPDPSGARTPSNNGYYQPGTPAVSPAPRNGTQNNPGNSVPNAPVAPTPTNRLFQDPAKTSKYPNSDPAVGSANGSSGKFAKRQKRGTNKSFSKNHKHLKKTKKHDNNNSEKSRKESSETR